MRFRFYKQPDAMDCGPTCLRMVTKYYGRDVSMQKLRLLCGVEKEGVSLLGIAEAAEKLGFTASGERIDLTGLKQAELPCILHWRQQHFVVLYKIRQNNYYLADPEMGLLKVNEQVFKKNWLTDDIVEAGIVLLLKPTDAFYNQESEGKTEISWSFLFKFIIVYRKLFIRLILGLGVGSLLQLIAPFFTQSIVDIGIKTNNLNFIYVILLAQGALIVGRVSVEFIRSWILLHISTRINLTIVTDFLIKLMKLPMSFFDAKMTGDIMQRLDDQRNVQTFLTGPALNTLFAIVNFIIFSLVLIYYNKYTFFVFVIFSALYTGWIIIFLKRRRVLNYNNFELSASNQGNIVELISGMQEIKLNTCEDQKRWEWENIQVRLFKYNIRSLSLNQYQQGGATLINETKNLLITLLSAEAVISGNMTLGALVAIQYIVGQLNSPIEQALNFIQNFQDTKISLERLNEIHQLVDEEPASQTWENKLPADKGITLKTTTFVYPGTGNEPVLKGINLHIPQGKTTAIVGMSGSGKTTLLKLLLRFYPPQAGWITVGDQPVNDISLKAWRQKCGVVMQDGFIFSDSIENNIAVGAEKIDQDRLNKAVKIANIQDLINELPAGFKTRLGTKGKGISQGQRQRLLIARAVYKNPDYIFFDEATNALDAKNETVIMNNLRDFFKGRTVVVVAHRLSTVKNAGNIVVLDKGIIKEQGTHEELVALKGGYYELVKDQLSLGE
jgi:ATP-binding cassette subfamily B protein